MDTEVGAQSVDAWSIKYQNAGWKNEGQFLYVSNNFASRNEHLLSRVKLADGETVS